MLQLRKPMNFNRPDGDYSLVEQCILRALDVSAYDFQRTASGECKTPQWLNEATVALQTSKQYRFA